MAYGLIALAIVLILIGVVMVATGFDVAIPKLGSAGVVLVVLGIIVAIAYVILVLVGQIPH